jgi:hypothetical protein
MGGSVSFMGWMVGELETMKGCWCSCGMCQLILLSFSNFPDAMTFLNRSGQTRSTVLMALTLVGASAIAMAPAQAEGIKNATIGGSAATDYLLYDANGTNTVLNPNANLQTILGGDSANPTGNVELAASSEKPGFDFTKNTALNGTIGGRDISISSLTAADWGSSYQGTTFGQYWFSSALTAHGFGMLNGSPTGTALFNLFKGNGGFERFSDPNISYVNQDSNNVINIGLAGHYDASPLFANAIDQYVATTPLSNNQKQLMTRLKSRTIQASEVVKTTYGGKTDYGFSFLATKSGLVERGDGLSHTGNYVVSLQGLEPVTQKVPEPSIVFSLVGLGGLAVRKLRRG